MLRQVRSAWRIKVFSVASAVLVAVGFIALFAASCGAKSSDGGASRPRISPPYHYTGSLPASLREELSLPKTLQISEIFQCDHLDSVPYSTRTLGRDACHEFGDSKDLVVAYYWTPGSTSANVIHRVRATLRQTGWTIEDSRGEMFGITRRGWHGEVTVYKEKPSKSSNAIQQVQVAVAVSPK